jgi:hypothetical protein
MNTDDTVEKAQTHQAEGYSFWRVIEKYIAEANPSPGDDCYNGVMMLSLAQEADECAGYMYVTDYDMGDGADICYNMNTHTVSADTDETSCDAYMYLENYGEETYTGCYNTVSHNMDATWNQSICESWNYYEDADMGGDELFTGCYNMESHAVSSDDNATCTSYMWIVDYVTVAGEDGCYNSVSHTWDTAADQATCESYDWYVNYGATMFTGCYNMVSHTTNADMTEAECGAFTHFDGFGTTGINGIYDFSNVPVAGTDYQAAVRAHLQPAWDMLGITAEDIGTLQ